MILDGIMGGGERWEEVGAQKVSWILSVSHFASFHHDVVCSALMKPCERVLSSA